MIEILSMILIPLGISLTLVALYHIAIDLSDGWMLKQMLPYTLPVIIVGLVLLILGFGILFI
jgi:hypothetical protein